MPSYEGAQSRVGLHGKEEELGRIVNERVDAGLSGIVELCEGWMWIDIET